MLWVTSRHFVAMSKWIWICIFKAPIFLYFLVTTSAASAVSQRLLIDQQLVHSATTGKQQVLTCLIKDSTVYVNSEPTAWWTHAALSMNGFFNPVSVFLSATISKTDNKTIWKLGPLLTYMHLSNSRPATQTIKTCPGEATGQVWGCFQRTRWELFANAATHGTQLGLQEYIATVL